MNRKANGVGLFAENQLGWQHGGILEQVPGGADRAPGGAVDDSPSNQVEAAPVKLDPAPQPVGASGAVVGEKATQAPRASRRPRFRAAPGHNRVPERTTRTSG